MAAIYTELFRCYVREFNWVYRDGWDENPFLQHSFLFTLYLLQIHGSNPRPVTFYQDYFLQAFPMVLETTENNFMDVEQVAKACYRHRVLRNFTVFLGLASMKATSNEISPDYEIQSLPLLFEIVTFRNLTPRARQ